jgi:hypothetical protein
MEAPIAALPFAGSLLVGMLVCMEVGRRLGLRALARDPAAGDVGTGPVDGALFGLFGLLVAFTFSGAPARFDHRRDLIANEANDIGTAYLRIDLLAESEQPALRGLFRNYLDSRLAFYAALPDIDAAQRAYRETLALQARIWEDSLRASQVPGGHPDAGKLLLPALNSMIDVTTTRLMAAQTHPPRIIFHLLFAMGLLCAGVAGQGMVGSRRRYWLHALAFCLTTSIAIFVILEIEYPRSGLIRLDRYDQVLVELRRSMDAP